MRTGPARMVVLSSSAHSTASGPAIMSRRFFKSVRNSLPDSLATWAFSGRGGHVTQDHPVYIPRAVQRLVRLMGAEHLIRRSGRAVQDRPLRPVGWADIPGLSIRGRRCPPSWQQHWQQSHRTALGRLPSRQGPADELRVAEPRWPGENANEGAPDDQQRTSGYPHPGQPAIGRRPYLSLSSTSPPAVSSGSPWLTPCAPGWSPMRWPTPSPPVNPHRG
jgi:hypothetical protein